MVAFIAVAWWLAMRHHDDYDAATGFAVILPFWAAVAIITVVLKWFDRKWPR